MCHIPGPIERCAMTVEAAGSERFFSEEGYARVLRASPAAFSPSTLDDGRYLEVNDRFLRVTGYTRDEVIGRRSSELGRWSAWADRARVGSGRHRLRAAGMDRLCAGESERP